MSATTKSRHAVGRGRRHSQVRVAAPVQSWRLRVVAFCVGAASLGAEIAAARLLAPYFGASTIIWANTIATVLTALSVGYAVGDRFADRRADMRGLCVIVLGASVLLAIVPFVSDPFLHEAVRALGVLSVGGFVGSLAAVLVLVAVPVLLPGMVSPYANRLAVARISDTGTVTGRLYAISTAGSLLGTFLAALLLIPLIGTHRTFLAFAAMLAIAAAVGAAHGDSWSSPPRSARCWRCPRRRLAPTSRALA
ncbi:MAG TPA: fused MFS/spermidine synthase [Solirubrobacteraceae bacterium]|nr:fused MFS/spermidine synthase [Solirubrobacteraceae bacterium]